MPVSSNQGFIAPRPGGIELDTVRIHNFDDSEVGIDGLPGQDIRLLTLEFNIYESLGCDHLRADLVITDALSLIAQMPIIGDEWVEIKFRTPSQSPDSYQYPWITLQFQVAKLEKLQTGKIREEIYKLVLVSKERLVDLKTIVQIYLEGTASSMVQKVATEFLQITNLRMGAAESQHRLVIPSMKPMETIHFIASEAQSAAVQSSNYIFYQDHTQFNFITTEELQNMPVLQTYYVTEQSLTARKGGSLPTSGALIDTTGLEQVEKANANEFRCMHSIVLEKTFDKEVNLRQGMYDNIAYSVDPLLQQFIANPPLTMAGQGTTGSSSTEPTTGGLTPGVNFQYLPQFPAFKHTAQRDTGHPVITELSLLANGTGQSSLRYVPTNKNQTASYDVIPRLRQNFLEMLSSYIGQNDSVVCTLSIPGDSYRKAGDCIYFNLHEIGATDDILFKLNKYFSGKFMVTAVRHKYTSDVGYTTIMQCVKNCFEAEITHTQPPRSTQANRPLP